MTLHTIKNWSDPANEETKHPVGGPCGVSLYIRTDEPTYRPGTTLMDATENTTFVFGKATADVVAGACAYDPVTFEISAGVGYAVSADIKTNEYGWATKATL